MSKNYHSLDFTFCGYIKSISPRKTSKNNNTYIVIECVNFDYLQNNQFILFDDKFNLDEVQQFQFIKIDGIVKIDSQNRKTWCVPRRLQILASPHFQKMEETEKEIKRIETVVKEESSDNEIDATFENERYWGN